MTVGQLRIEEVMEHVSLYFLSPPLLLIIFDYISLGLI